MSSKAWLWVPGLYFVQGLPYALVALVAAVFYQRFGIANATIAFWVSLFYFPWVLKFFWAPVVEALGTKRRWVLLVQLLFVVAILLLIVALKSNHFFQFSLLLFFVIAFLSATYDVASDGFYLVNLDISEQAYFVGVRTIFYQLARLFCEGGLIIFIGYLVSKLPQTLAWQIGFILLAVILLFFCLLHVFILPKNETVKKQSKYFTAIIATYMNVIKSFLKIDKCFLLLLFILVYNGAIAQLLRIVPLFLLDNAANGGMGLTTVVVGYVYGVCGVVAALLGVAAAGWLIARTKVENKIALFSFILFIANFSYLILSWFRINDIYIIILLVIVAQFAFGLANGAYMIYLMHKVAVPPYKTSFYAIGSGVMALGMLIFGSVSGYVQHILGYRSFFVWILLLSFVIFLFTHFVIKYYNKGSYEYS